MTNNGKVWPCDKLGNPIKEGDLVHLSKDQLDPLFAVLKIEPASVLHSPDGPMPVNGSIRFGLFFELPYSPEMFQMHKAIVVKQPEGQQKAMKDALQ
jgi:hypothetical protein